MIAELMLILLTAVLINNPVLYYFLGLCPYLGVSNKVDMALGMGMAVTFVMTVAASLTWVVNNLIIFYLNAGYGIDLGFLRYTIFIFVIAGTVQLVEMFLRKFFPHLYDRFGIFLPLITTNCAILGCCLWIDVKGYNLVAGQEGVAASWKFAQALLFGIGNGLGFTLAICLMAGIRERLNFSDVPRDFRGVGITLIVAAILAMAFMGFSGIGG
ncbi:MAG: electron transport complex subunit RsxA [Actinobacteria bacterium]|nr:electron transport complex subunit RsxA [Actinomycetota bacterium]